MPGDARNADLLRPVALAAAALLGGLFVAVRDGSPLVAGLVAGVSLVIFVLLARIAGLERVLRLAAADEAEAESDGMDADRFRSLVQNSSDLMTVMDAQGRVTYQSPAIEQVLGYRGEDMVGAELERFVHESDLPAVRRLVMEVLTTPSASPGRIGCRVRHRDGTLRHVETTITNLLGDPSVAGIVLNTRDVTERNQLQAQLAHQAYHDELTGLANRALFLDRVERALARSARTRRLIAVLYLDLDDFKKINDSLGHSAGDLVLLRVARRLSSCLRTSDMAARLGGDEFAILLDDGADALTAADRIEEALARPFELDGLEVCVTASVGIATAGAGMETAEELLRNADVAMYRAKESGKAHHEAFTPDLHVAARLRLDTEAELRRAVKNDEFTVVYQPIVAIDHGRIRGFEALVRWEHPQRGLLLPADFISMAEQNGSIVPIGKRVLERACRQAAEWQARYESDPPLTMSVNMSAAQLHAPGVVGMVEEALERSGLDPRQLILEVTESVVMSEGQSTTLTLAELKGLGVQLAIDDFGTGFSSLSYLQRFAMDWIKIPRSFCGAIGSDPRAPALIQGIIELGRSLGLDVIAEGVEHADQWLGLREMDCDLAQGFYFARPQAPETAEAFLQAEQMAAEFVEARDNRSRLRLVSGSGA